MRRARSITRRGAGPGTQRSSPYALANEQEFLRQSIEDLEEQLVSGEVDKEDFAVLHSRYGSRLTEVEAAIADLASAGQAGNSEDPEVSVGGLDGVPSAPSAPSGSRLRRRLASPRARLVIGIAAAGCFVVAATLLAA